MKSKLLFLDIETGATALSMSLLSAYFATFDQDFNLIGELDLKLIPDDGVFHVKAAPGHGLAINQINLIEHAKVAIPYKEGATQLFNYLRMMYNDEQNRVMMTPVGHNVKKDIEHLTDKLVSRGSWDSFVSYRTIDTCSVAKFLQFQGKLPEEATCGLQDLAKFFNVKIDGDAHEAKADVLTCVEVFKCLSNIK